MHGRPSSIDARVLPRVPLVALGVPAGTEPLDHPAMPAAPPATPALTPSAPDPASAKLEATLAKIPGIGAHADDLASAFRDLPPEVKGAFASDDPASILRAAMGFMKGGRRVSPDRLRPRGDRRNGEAPQARSRELFAHRVETGCRGRA
jgi:hypothetical protein